MPILLTGVGATSEVAIPFALSRRKLTFYFVLVLGRERIAERGLLSPQQECIRCIKHERLLEQVNWLGLYRRRFKQGLLVLVRELPGTSQELSGLEDVENIPNVQQARLNRRSRARDTETRRKTFQSMGDLRAG